MDRELEVDSDADLEIELAVRQFNLPHEFSPATVLEAEKLPNKVLAKDRARRVDLRDVPFAPLTVKTLETLTMRCTLRPKAMALIDCSWPLPT